jgi:hypothetical protein
LGQRARDVVELFNEGTYFARWDDLLEHCLRDGESEAND